MDLFLPLQSQSVGPLHQVLRPVPSLQLQLGECRILFTQQVCLINLSLPFFSSFLDDVHRSGQGEYSYTFIIFNTNKRGEVRSSLSSTLTHLQLFFFLLFKNLNSNIFIGGNETKFSDRHLGASQNGLAWVCNPHVVNKKQQQQTLSVVLCCRE